MASRLKLARAGAAVAGVSVALMMTAAIPAGADPVTGKVDPKGYDNGYHVNVGKGHKDMSTSLIGFELADGSRLRMYCVEIKTGIDEKHRMVEQPWDKYPNADSPFHENRDKINWILHNGYPVVGTDKLAQSLTEGGVTLKNGLDKKEAIAATQAAVWHFSDGTDLNKKNPLPKGPEDAKADVVALYDYLTGDANIGVGDQPTPALQVAPTELTGEAGTRIGPFTVNTTGDIEKLTADLPEGVKITDVDGVEFTADKIKNGAELFLDVPETATEGGGTFELTASASIDTGRLFVGENYGKKKTQSLIVATAEKSEIVASAGGKWSEKPVTPPTTTTGVSPTTSETVPTTETTTTTPAPAPQPKNDSGDLAETGASIFMPIMIGVVLVGAGVGALLFQRHRKRA